MMIFQLPIFLVPPQDLVPYAQRVVRVMGAAALVTLILTHELSGGIHCWSWSKKPPCLLESFESSVLHSICG